MAQKDPFQLPEITMEVIPTITMKKMISYRWTITSIQTQTLLHRMPEITELVMQGQNHHFQKASIRTDQRKKGRMELVLGGADLGRDNRVVL
ncbi:MAG: hypothetical protein EZS28_020567 [Streblomastix strix]|uniref:Uncharacterized protein n=1 Tax=Streblomastix strix TaxID=222440 RepID=A0A5J4VMN8_9EUKA|nr:MAG: hypothetical protein EZS28_020567 [Streblomastix strix]